MRLLVVLVLVGCSVDEPDTLVVNHGEVCVYAWPPGLSFDADVDELALVDSTSLYDRRGFELGTPILIRVFKRASPCATDVEASCTVRKSGGQLIVENRASWNEPAEGTFCPRLPSPVAKAYCVLPPLETGNYVVRFSGVGILFPYLPDSTFEQCFRP